MMLMVPLGPVDEMFAVWLFLPTGGHGRCRIPRQWPLRQGGTQSFEIWAHEMSGPRRLTIRSILYTRDRHADVEIHLTRGNGHDGFRERFDFGADRAGAPQFQIDFVEGPIPPRWPS